MSERYSNVFTLQKNLYAVGSPVIIAAGTLLKDNQTGGIVAQMKFRSISNKTIKAVKVKLDLFDTAGNPISEPVMHDYLDLSASRDAEFCQKTPVPVSNNKARSYGVAVTEVVFGDKSMWTSNDEPWEALSEPSLLPIDDSELLKQYKMCFGYNCKYAVMEEKDLWHCACGTWNHKNEECHVCQNSISGLLGVDMAELTEAKEERVAAEEKQKAIEKQKAATKKTKRIAICVIAAVILLFCTIITQIITSSPEYIAKQIIKEGFEYYQNREFSKAFSTWQKVGQAPVDTSKTYAPGVITNPTVDASSAGYTPTNEELLAYGEDLFYEYAYLVACDSFIDAIPLFELISDYKDSADIVTEMKLLLDMYVGEYECTSNYVKYSYYDDIFYYDLMKNVLICDLSYHYDELGKVCIKTSRDESYWYFVRLRNPFELDRKNGYSLCRWDDELSEQYVTNYKLDGQIITEIEYWELCEHTCQYRERSGRDDQFLPLLLAGNKLVQRSISTVDLDARHSSFPRIAHRQSRGR